MKESAYKKLLLAVLLVVLAFNYVDRMALGLVLLDIQADLKLSDTQLGVLTGIAFALFYAAMGIPIARWADRGNRVTIISLAVTVWCFMVALCGLAASFAQLLLIRVGVAVGEAGCIPPAHSLIADNFSRAERPRAVAVYMLGGYLSVVLGYFVAGWLNEIYGWRQTFMMLGAPGLVLGPLAWFTLREPRNAGRAARRSLRTAHSWPETVAPSSSQVSLRETAAILWTNATFRHLLLCFSAVSFFAYGIGQWQPAFFIRSYRLNTGELGTWFAVLNGLGGALGTYYGGALASRRAAGNERLQLLAMAIVCCAVGAISALIYLASNRYLAFAVMGLTTVGGATVSGPLFATIQTLVPERMRATAIAILYLFANCIGMGLGPLVAGALSDGLRPLLGEDSLRYALLALCPGYVWAGWHAWRASRTVARDLDAVQVECNGPISLQLRPCPSGE